MNNITAEAIWTRYIGDDALEFEHFRAAVLGVGLPQALTGDCLDTATPAQIAQIAAMLWPEEAKPELVKWKPIGDMNVTCAPGAVAAMRVLLSNRGTDTVSIADPNAAMLSRDCPKPRTVTFTAPEPPAVKPHWSQRSPDLSASSHQVSPAHVFAASRG